MVDKAQLKIQQMAFMLMAVTLLFVLVLLFVIVFKFAGLKESATALEEKNAMLLSTKLANSPEFACGGVFDGDKTNCIDADKIMVLKQNIDKYEGFWGNVLSIEVIKISTKGKIECNRNYPKCDKISLKQDASGKGVFLNNFVSLCRKDNFEEEVYNHCDLGLLRISYKDWREE